MSVNGKTSVFGIIGRPVSHSLSPVVQNAFFKALGINGVYAAFDVEGSIKKAVEGAYALGIRGFNVTHPYKKDVMPLLSEIDEFALRIEAVNTLKYTENGYAGYNTDVYGLIRAFEKHDISFENCSALILGAGGGASACAFAAALHGAKRIYIANRTNYNSELLATRIKKYYNIEAESISYDEMDKLDGSYFILQATTVGMGSDSSPVKDINVLKKSCGIMDIIYSPAKTKILREAENLGLIAVNGLDMLVFQAVKAFEIWNAVKIDDVLISNVAELLKDYV